MEINHRVVALIPARAGSKRVKDKNIRTLAGHPLIAYTISAAFDSKVFDDVVVSTDSDYYASIAMHYGASIPFLRPVEFAGCESPDFGWVEYTMNRLKQEGKSFDCFSILRPTSPFRRSETIIRAWTSFLQADGIDSLRAVEKCHQHPGKMWVVRGKRMFPLLPLSPPDQPWHSSQYPVLPEVYVQNASMEIAWTKVLNESRTIAGHVIIPFFTNGDEGFDVNNEYDWKLAELMIEQDKSILPYVDKKPFSD